MLKTGPVHTVIVPEVDAGARMGLKSAGQIDNPEGVESRHFDDLLKSLREGLLRLHKTLLEWERGAYERTHGRQASHELLEALLKEPQFAWLRSISQLIVRIDEILEDEIAPGPGDVEAVLAHARDLTTPNEAGNSYEQRYYAALQEYPDAVFAHRDLVAVLKTNRT